MIKDSLTITEELIADTVDSFCDQDVTPESLRTGPSFLENLRAQAISGAIRPELFTVLEAKILGSHHFPQAV